MTGFTAQIQTPTERTADGMALDLRDAYAARFPAGRPRAHNLVGSRAEFVRLLYHEPAAEVERTFRWYLGHLGDKDLPRVWSGGGFARHYRTLHACCLRDRANVLITVTAHLVVAQDLLGLVWSRGAAAQVPVVVQLSLDAYDPYLTRVAARRRVIHQYANAAADDPVHYRARRLRDLIDHLDADLLTPRHAVACWMRQVHQQVGDWPAWSGNLMPWVFDAKHELYRRWGRRRAEEFLGDPVWWDRLMDEVNP